MCTCGALSTHTPDGRLVSYLLKTSDSDFTPHWHGYVSNPRGHDVLAFGKMKQGGINAGMNAAGLALLMSYLDYRVPPGTTATPHDDIFVRWPDDRGLINAALLARCSTVAEGLDFLYDAIGRRPGIVSGNHFIADRSGAIAIFEQCDGRMAHRVYQDGGIASRGNDGLLIWRDEQDAMPDVIRQDRRRRRETMERALAPLGTAIEAGDAPAERIGAALQTALSAHAEDGPTGVGSICAHAVQAPGARTPMAGNIWTMSGVILDIANGRMRYSLGNPCHGRWHDLAFETDPMRHADLPSS
jgi:hypothetical protein